MTCGTEYAPELRARGYRVTAQRLAVLHALHHAGSRLSAGEVWQRARAELPSLTETTVYRTLDFLARNGFAWPIRSRTGRLVYEFAGERHHHLICVRCGAEVELDDALLKKAHAKLETASGYRLVDDHLAFFGICPDCQLSEPKKGA